MLIVYKYPIPMVEEFSLSLPATAEILTVQMQGHIPQLWALVDPDALTETRRFRLAGTGHLIDQRKGYPEYIATFQMADGDLVWHLFELEEKD